MIQGMIGAEVILNMLKEEGVEYIFGCPGSTETPIIHAMVQTPKFQYVLAAHESVCVGMADGYARSSGKLGVVMAHTTPGTVNLIGNLDNAYKAGTPILVIVGQQDSRLEYRDSWLDLDLEPMVRQVTKSYWKVNRLLDLPLILNRAIKEAKTMPMGPVFVVIPQDLQAQPAEVDIPPAECRRLAMSIRPDSESLTQAVKLILEAKNPVILAGHEVADADGTAELMKLAETIAAPVFTAYEPRMIFPNTHPLYFSWLPPYADAYRQIAATADVLLALGSDVFKLMEYPETPFLAPTTKLIHIDLNPQGLAKSYPAELALVGNLKATLGEMVSEIEQRLSPEQKEGLAQKAKGLAGFRSQLKSADEARYGEVWDAMPIRGWRVWNDIAATLPPDTAVINESIMLSTYAPKTIKLSLSSIYYNCSGYLGWGIPTALGVSLATGRKPVIAVVGDGCAMFGVQALWTAARYDLPVVMVVLNNQGYAAIRNFVTLYGVLKEQMVDTSAVDLGDSHLDKIAEGFGISARRVEKPEDIRPSLEWGFKLRKPVLIEVMVDPADPGYRPPEPAQT